MNSVLEKNRVGVCVGWDGCQNQNSRRGEVRRLDNKSLLALAVAGKGGTRREKTEISLRLESRKEEGVTV